MGGGGGTQMQTQNTCETPVRVGPSISITPHNGDYLNSALCAADCFNAAVTYTTPAYTSMDLERASTLVYSSQQAWPMPLVQVDVTDNESDPFPVKASIRLKTAGGAWVTFTNGLQENFYNISRGTWRLGAQFDASSLSTGAYNYTAVVRTWFADGTSEEGSAVVTVLVVNERNSVFGWGWSLAGLQNLHIDGTGSVLITEGNGSAAYFRKKCSTCGYTTPYSDFSTLTYDGTYYTRRYPDGTIYKFYSTGRLWFAQDKFGNRTTYYHNSNGRLSTIQDPAGRYTYFAYDANGKIAHIQSDYRYSYTTVDGSTKNLLRITDPDGTYALQATYDAQHRMRQRTDRRGGNWSFAYDRWGKLAADSLPTITADGASKRPVHTFRSLEMEVLPPPGTGTSSSPASSVTTPHPKLINPRGYATTLTIDRFGAPLSVSEPLGRYSTFTRDHNSLVTRSTAASGHQIVYTWGSRGELKKIDDQTTGRVVETSYETTYYRPTRITADGEFQHFYYTGVRLDSTRTNNIVDELFDGINASPTRYTTDSRGRFTSVVSPGPEGHTTTFHYSTTGFMNMDSVVAPGGRRTSFTYDSYGRPRTVRNPMNQIDTLSYDALNRPTRTARPGGRVTTYGYDALYLTSVTDALGQMHGFAHNPLGWVETKTDPNGRQERFTYDLNGNVKSWTNRRGQTVGQTYDELNQILSLTADGVVTSYKHDPDGLFVAASNSVSTDTIKFDAAGRPTHEITVRGGVRYVLESTFNYRHRVKLQMTSPWSRSIEYSYKGLQLDTLRGFDNANTAIGYNERRQVAYFKLPTGDSIFMRYPSTTQPAQVEHSISSLNHRVGVRYRQDLLSRANRRSNIAGDSIRELSYDALGQLDNYADYAEAFVSGDCSWDPDSGFICEDSNTSRTLLASQNYSYDAVGNRTDSNAATTTGNRLVSFDGYTLQYDYDGNLTRKVKSGVVDQTFTWNSLGQLSSVTTNGSTVSYGYDAWGRWVRRTDGNGTLQYIYDGDDLLVERLERANSPSAWYAHYPGIDRPHSMLRDGAIYYYALDYPGHVLGVINANNSLSNEYRYLPFGTTEMRAETVGNPFQFMARHWEPASNLYQVRARWYDPQVGRFISEDPSGLAGGINSYVYAGNNPIDFTDPSGLRRIKWWFSAASFLTTLGFASAGELSFGAALEGTIKNFAATAVGSAVAAGVETMASDNDKSFVDAFVRNYGLSTMFTAGGAALGHLFSGGVAGIGANTWYQGYISAVRPILIAGGMTMGSSAVFSGRTQRQRHARHEAGHTVQFMALSVAGNPWGPYVALGVLGLTNGGNWWENHASRVGPPVSGVLGEFD
jgi:RHS repeat-associated protein